MTITHLILRYVHITGGMVALISGAAAMSFSKGARLHRISGKVFVGPMLVMAAAGVTISTDPLQFFTSSSPVWRSSRLRWTSG